VLLNGRLTLHQPGCDGRRCIPSECIADVEKLASSVISSHERAGVKRNGRVDGPGMTLTASGREDLLSYLIAEAWKASQRFRPGDDGRRPGNRLAGFVVKTLHFRLIDWVRLTKGSTRYPTHLIVTEIVEYRPDVHDQPHWDAEYDDGDALDLDAASDGTAEAIALLRPLVDDETPSQTQLAALAGVSTCRVGKAVRLVRRELALQGLAPDTSAEPSTLNLVSDRKSG
jgi:DNA-directed RNA polymerase specialized sigma24 family protein